MSVAVAATIALGATGCEFMSPAQTTEIKQITDGVNVTTGKIDVRNALLISDGGDDARFIGTLVNNDETDDITVSVEIGGDTETVEVPASSHVDLANDAQHDTLDFAGADAKPGSLVKVYFSYSGAEGVSASVPVLTSAQEEYQTLAPTSTPTSEITLPVETPSATPTDTPINP
ncbi:DNA modification methylase [Curtobacterium sp. SP.BCo]|uniref:DNA modification methylase n=1 Tax=Curtobacterium sp. SP.BCo TaxID=3435229 RepID=UPI003F73A27A